MQINGFWVFDGSAPINGTAHKKWWARQLEFLNELQPSQLTNPRNCSRYLRRWHRFASHKFPPINDKTFRFVNLFKKRAIYICSRNLIYVKIPSGIGAEEIRYIVHGAALNFMWGNAANECYKPFELFIQRLPYRTHLVKREPKS